VCRIGRVGVGDAEADTIAGIGAAVVVAVPTRMAVNLLLLLSKGRSRFFPLDGRGGARGGKRVLEAREGSSNPTGRGLVLMMMVGVIMIILMVWV
jgi:hypothetical protein